MRTSKTKRQSKFETLTDQEIIALCLQGAEEAWEELVRRYKRMIYSIPVRLGFQPSDAADVFQAVCITLLEHLHDLEDEQKLPGWLATTTVRQCSRWLRQHPRKHDLEESWEDPALDLESLSIAAEAQQKIVHALQELPERCRSLLRMYYLEGETPTYEEISRELDIPLGSIAVTRSRCLEKLRAVLHRRGMIPPRPKAK